MSNSPISTLDVTDDDLSFYGLSWLPGQLWLRMSQKDELMTSNGVDHSRHAISQTAIVLLA